MTSILWKYINPLQKCLCCFLNIPLVALKPYVPPKNLKATAHKFAKSSHNLWLLKVLF